MFDPRRELHSEEEVPEESPYTVASQERFYARIEIHKRRGTILPRTTHALWWFVHNAVAHPLIGVAPIEPFFKFHDYTSDKINGKK